MDIESTTKLLESEHSYDSENSFQSEKQRIILNVGGFKHEIQWKTLDKIPDSRLGRLREAYWRKEGIYDLCDDFVSEKTEFFFDRDPTHFNLILNYYRIGKLHYNKSICPNTFKEELDYWDLDEPNMDLYCEEIFFKQQQAFDEVVDNYVKIFHREKQLLERENKINSTKFGLWRQKIFDITNKPFSMGLLAKVKLISMHCFP